MNTLKTIAYIAVFMLTGLSLTVQATVSQWPEQAQQYDKFKINSSVLAKFYDHQEHYLWLNKQQLNNKAHDALDFIAAASIHGLQPEHYHLSTLRKLDPAQDIITAQQFDILLTDGLLKLIHDIAVGRFEPSIADPDWFIPQTQFDAEAFLQQALLSDHLKSQLNTLIPLTTEYQKLIEVASRYQRYVDRGGWNKIPKTPLLRLGDKHKNIPAIQARLAFEDDYFALTHSLPSQHYDELMEQAVRRFQKKHSLMVDGIIGNETRHEMNISAQQRLQQIQINIERRRWLPTNLGHRYLLVNLANYTLQAIEKNTKKLDMRVIVGQKSRQTPSFASQMNRLVYNPYWNIPRKLAKLDLLPKQQADPNYFYLHDIRVFTNENGQRIEHNPHTIDWQSVSRYDFPYTFRQDPGDHNALGKLKFMFPNKWDIYLHDTSHKELFSESNRSFSSGCIRVEDPIALANFSLATTNTEQPVLDIIASNENRGQKLAEPLAIYVVYLTVSVDGDDVIFSPDVYHRDKRMAELL